MRIKASNLPHWVSRHSGVLPLNALPVIDKHLLRPGDTVIVGLIVYTYV